MGVIQKRPRAERVTARRLQSPGENFILEGVAPGKSIHQSEQKFTKHLPCARLVTMWSVTVMNKSNTAPALLGLTREKRPTLPCFLLHLSPH